MKPTLHNFFSALEAALPQGQTLSKEMAKTLNISISAAYRRINGEVALLLDEAITLSEKFKVSLLDFTYYANNKICFTYYPLFGKNYNNTYTHYLFQLESALKKLIKKEGVVFVSASDIPLGFLTKYPILMAFKLFCWENEMISKQNPTFFFASRPLPFQNAFKNFEKLYRQANSKEVWTKHTFSSFLESVKLYKDVGLIPPNELALLKSELLHLFNDVEAFATSGEKDMGGKFDLYIAPLNLPNTLYLLDISENEQVSFLKLYTINSIWTEDIHYCMEQKKWFESLINASSLISKSNLKNRKHFFMELHAKTEAL